MAVVAGLRNIELRARMSELRILINANAQQDTQAVLEEAEATIAELTEDDPESLARAWEALSMARAMRAEMELMAEACEHLLAVARRAGLHRHNAWASWELAAGVALGSRPVDQATERVEQLLAGLPEAESWGVESYLALLYSYGGRHAEAHEIIERSLRRLRELGQLTFRAGLSMNAGWIALLAGKPERAEAELRKGAAVLEQAGESGFRSTVTAVLAEVLYELGRDEDAEECTRWSEEATSPEDVLSQTLWRATRAKLVARRGEHDEAMRLSTEAVEWARQSDALPSLGDALFARGEVLETVGRGDEARTAYEEALTVYERKGIVPAIERTKQALAEFA
jgi:tetratricopeptide (TPR) repeat protein